MCKPSQRLYDKKMKRKLQISNFFKFICIFIFIHCNETKPLKHEIEWLIDWNHSKNVLFKYQVKAWIVDVKSFNIAWGINSLHTFSHMHWFLFKLTCVSQYHVICLNIILYIYS